MDPREVLEREAEDALEDAKARVRAAVNDALADVLRDVGVRAPRELSAAASDSSGERMTRSDTARLFGVTMSKLRSLESRGLISPRRRGGRIMLDPDEVATALGVAKPKT